jgi:hypothetical protein
MTAKDRETAQAAGLEVVTVRELKPGEFFTLHAYTDPDAERVYIRGEYDRSERRYICGKFSGIGAGRYFKPGAEVITGFTF